LALARGLVNRLGLDVRADPDDREFLQFQTLAFNRVLEHYQRLVSAGPRSWSWRDSLVLADALVKAQAAYDAWCRSQGQPPKLMFLMTLSAIARALMKSLRT
jgi:hypothetical protein